MCTLFRKDVTLFLFYILISYCTVLIGVLQNNAAPWRSLCRCGAIFPQLSAFVFARNDVSTNTLVGRPSAYVLVAFFSKPLRLAVNFDWFRVIFGPLRSVQQQLGLTCSSQRRPHRSVLLGCLPWCGNSCVAHVTRPYMQYANSYATDSSAKSFLRFAVCGVNFVISSSALL